MPRLQLAKAGCRCDYALYVGAASDNASILPAIASKAAGLKMYLNDTYSTLKMDNVSLWMEVGGVTLPHSFTDGFEFKLFCLIFLSLDVFF